VLCKGLPVEFSTLLQYVRNLKFEEKPDYKFYRTLLKDMMIENGLKYDYLFDWCLLGEGRLVTETLVVELQGDGAEKGEVRVY
jgi:hypothetical protein